MIILILKIKTLRDLYLVSKIKINLHVSLVLKHVLIKA